jgi:hypothetical protein
MQTWAILAAKHAALMSGIGLGTIPAMSWDSVGGFAVGLLLAGVGFAVLISPRRARNCPLPQPDAVRAGRPEARSHDGGRIARARRWVDGLLTGMLSDDVDLVTAAPESWGTGLQQAEQDAAEPATAEPATAGRDSAQHDPDQPVPAPPEREELASSAERTFWGLDETAASASGNGYRSKHRQAGAAGDPGLQDGRGKPRHAAPPAGLGVTLGRRLSSPRLTSRSAAHAGG